MNSTTGPEPRLKITYEKHRYQVTLDGTDITHLLKDVRLDLSNAYGPEASLVLTTGLFESYDGETRTRVDDTTAALLTRLGWSQTEPRPAQETRADA